MAVASAVPVEYHHQQPQHHEAPAEYEFSYSVHDEHTGDIKSQQESRKGDSVQGHYELIDSDGFKRIVEYTADEHTGFNAVVHREPTDIKIPVHVAKVVAPVHYSHSPAPQHYAPAPVQHYSHAPAAHHYSAPPAPVHHYSHEPTVHQYSHAAPIVQKVYKPVVAKVVAPVVAKVVAPVSQHYAPAPVSHHYAPAPVAHHQHSYEPAHVTFNAPEVNYHY